MPTGSDLTRLRIAQACREPKTPAEIVSLLEADEAVESLDEAALMGRLDELEAASLVEELPGGRFLTPNPFSTDLRRRVAAVLSVPLSAQGVQLALVKQDDTRPPVDVATIEETLGQLAQAGVVLLVASEGDGERTPAGLVNAVQAEPLAIDIPAEKAETLVERLEDPRRAWQVAGDQYVLTTLGFDLLQVT